MRASTLHRGGLNWRGGAAGSATTGRKRNEKLLTGLTALLQSMDADESQEDDEEGDLLEDLKQLMNQRPTALLRALTDLVAKHTAFSSRPAEEDEWIEVSRQKAGHYASS